MKENEKWGYWINTSNDNITSAQGMNKKRYITSEAYTFSQEISSVSYYNPVSQGMNIFGSIISKILTIKNKKIKQKVLQFITEFIKVLEEIQGLSNVFSPFMLMEEEDSVFLEWAFKDFRIGFTFCENEDESMWFMISNRNLEELSVSGDLRMSDYYSIIVKVVGFVVRNT